HVGRQGGGTTGGDRRAVHKQREIRRVLCAAIVVDHRLDKRQGRRFVIIGNRAGLVVTRSQRDRPVRRAVPAPGGCRIARIGSLSRRVEHVDGKRGDLTAGDRRAIHKQREVGNLLRASVV